MIIKLALYQIYLYIIYIIKFLKYFIHKFFIIIYKNASFNYYYNIKIL